MKKALSLQPLQTIVVGLELLQSLAGMEFTAFDVNTVSPPQDIGGMTALLAARVLLECLALACQTGSATS